MVATPATGSRRPRRRHCPASGRPRRRRPRSGGHHHPRRHHPRAPRPRIAGFGFEPVYGEDGGFWQLPPGPGEAILITDARHATKVEFLLIPTGTGVAGHAVSVGVDSNGRDAYTTRWRYEDQPLLGQLTVRATGPGGVTEHPVRVYHPDPRQP